MADKSLIESNRRMLESRRRPVVKLAAENGNNLYRSAQIANFERKNKIQAVNNSISTSMGKMKSDVDLTAYSPEEQKNIRVFLTSQRSKYANAANALAQIEDTSSPQYQHYVDVMSGVNNSFSNLKNQLDAYKTDKVQFAEGVRTGMYSEGNDEGQYGTAATIYGFSDGEKANAPFEIGDNGNLGFNIGGEYMAYNDFEEPFVKDYKVASGILSQTADLYKNHTLLQGPQKDMLRLNLMASLSDPNTIKSLVSDFESEGLNFSDISLDDMDAAKDMIVDRIMNSYTEVAAQGKADYDARSPSKQDRQESNSSGKDRYGYSKEESVTMIEGGSKMPIPTGKTSRKNGRLTVKLLPEAGKWVLCDAAGVPIETDGAFALTFDTEEQVKQYIK